VEKAGAIEAMYHITLYTLKDLATILNHEFLITGDVHAHTLETESNMWLISLGANAHVAEQDLLEFVTLLHSTIRQQLVTSNLRGAVTFYMWFDEQAGQLRFNVISGHIEKLPFGCIVQKVSDPTSIIHACLSSPYLHGIPEDETEDISFDEDRNDDDAIEYVLPVYVDYITSSSSIDW
jgi:hypothetical protein